MSEFGLENSAIQKLSIIIIIIMISFKGFVIEGAVDFITILEEDFPRQRY